MLSLNAESDTTILTDTARKQLYMTFLATLENVSTATTSVMTRQQALSLIRCTVSVHNRFTSTTETFG